MLAASGGVIDESYAKRAFAAILAAISESVGNHRVTIVETTGASDETQSYLDSLRARYDVRLVHINASWETCAARVKTREQSEQVQVPLEMVRTMHERSVALVLPWDLEIDNDAPLSREDVARAFGPFMSEATSR